MDDCMNVTSPIRVKRKGGTVCGMGQKMHAAPVTFGDPNMAGVRGLYRGLMPTLLGILPHAGTRALPDVG